MATVILVHRRTEEFGRRRGFMTVDDKLAAKLIKRGDAIAPRRRSRLAAAPPVAEAETATKPETKTKDEAPPVPPADPETDADAAAAAEGKKIASTKSGQRTSKER